MLAPLHAPTTIVARSPGLDPARVEIVITLPTYKRPAHLMETLDSLLRQRTSRPYAIIVMDNDAELREGSNAVRARFHGGAVNGLLIIANERGNCSAYNAGWDTAMRSFPNLKAVAVIDDDEIADPHWLDTLCSAAEQLGADIVGGPQIPAFEGGNNHPMAAHPVFAPPYAQTGLVPALYSSGNLLVSRNVLDAFRFPWLDTRFNFLGGGDSDFLSRARAKGFRLAWCNEAIIRETIPARRLEWDWVRARAIRNGVISTLVEKRRRSAEKLGAARTMAKSVLLLAASPVRAIMDFYSSRSLRIALYPVHVAAGRIMAEFGYAHEQYRDAEKN